MDNDYSFLNSENSKKANELIREIMKLPKELQEKYIYDGGRLATRTEKNRVQAQVLSDLNQLDKGETLEEQDARVMREYAKYLHIPDPTEVKQFPAEPDSKKEEIFLQDMAKLEEQAPKPGPTEEVLKQSMQSPTMAKVYNTESTYKAPQVYIPTQQMPMGYGYNHYTMGQPMYGYGYPQPMMLYQQPMVQQQPMMYQQPMMQQPYYGGYTAQPGAYSQLNADGSAFISPYSKPQPMIQQPMMQPQQPMANYTPGMYSQLNADGSAFISPYSKPVMQTTLGMPMYGGNPGYYQPGQYSYMYMYPGYQQQMQERQKLEQEAYESDLDIAATLLMNNHNYCHKNDNMTRADAKKFLTTPPEKRTNRPNHITFEDEIKIPEIRLMQGTEVLHTFKARVVRPNPEEVQVREESNYRFRQAMVYANARYNYIQNAKAAKFAEDRAKMRNKYPQDMSFSDFLNKYGVEMYIDALEYEMERQVRACQTLYDSSEFAKIVRKEAQRLNPLGYGAYGGFRTAGNNGGFIPFQNTGDLEIDLPNHLRAEHDKRKAEFFQKIVNGRTRV